MSLFTDKYIDVRRTMQSLGLDVPPGFAKYPMPSGGKSCEVRHLAARNEPDTCRRRQAQ